MESPPKEFQSGTKEDLPIFIKWMDFLKWLLVTTDNFPKKARFTYTDALPRGPKSGRPTELYQQDQKIMIQTAFVDGEIGGVR